MSNSTPDPEFVLSLAQQIVDAREQLKALEEKWESLFKASPMLPLTVDPPPKQSGRPRGEHSNTSRVLAAVTASAHVLEAEEVALMINMDPRQVSRALFKLYEDGKIDRERRGRYKAKATPPLPIGEAA